MTQLEVQYDFQPVGQGLFSSGTLHTQQARSRFRWVYDCGTTSAQTYVTQAIEGMARRAFRFSKPSFDLVTISHFDRDHISGLVTLLSTHTVAALLLPYMPLWQRLTIAESEGVSPNEPLFSLFVDPVAYVTAIEGAQIGQIILVPPSGDAGPDAGEGTPPPTGEGDNPWRLDLDEATPDDEDQRRDFNAMMEVARKAGTTLRFLKPGSSIRVSGLWEFVPYNDAALAYKADPGFRSEIADLQARLINPKSEDDRTQILEAIKNAYDATFGNSARNRNEISLFLYGGPLRPGYAFPLRWTSGPPLSLDWIWGQWAEPGRPKAGILYTGDGYLDTPQRADRLLGYLGPNTRVGQLGVLQVMHHGARGNWYKGIAARLAPLLSIFSSDPANKKLGHPHKPVLDDFAPYRPVQVNKTQGCYILAVIQF